MAVTSTKVAKDGQVVATWTDDTGGGTGNVIDMDGSANRNVQRVSGAGTYSVFGSNDGVTFGSAFITDDMTDDVIVIAQNPRFMRVDIAAADAEVIIVGSTH